MIKDFKPKIGKTVLETLTSGMYDDARVIYREYIQNAADQIDEAVEAGILKGKSEGKIEIKIDAITHTIVIEDNATGISEKDVLQFLGDVADSKKTQKKQKGFRGIGRLGGLGYCHTLIFETSYFGEPIRSKMTLDAKLLKKIIEDRRDTRDAAAAISIITTVEKTKEESNKHFFRVTLQNVSQQVLNIQSVKDYLSMVAPVPFSLSFLFADEIRVYLKSKKLTLDEYNIELNQETLFKGYKNTFIEDDGSISNLIGVDFIDIYNDEQDLIAICWYGFRDKTNIVIADANIEKGIRIRTKNITIGDEITSNRFFSQARTNLRFIGELHTIDEGFVPNARRDYFNENNTLQQFEKNAKEIFTLENLENRLAQTASRLYNRLKEIENYQNLLEEFKAQKGSYGSEAKETFQLNRLKELEEKAKKATREIAKISDRSKTVPNIKTLYQSIIGKKNIIINELTANDLQVSRYAPPSLEKLDEAQKIVVLEIFKILEDELDFELSELIKKRIVEKYN